MVITLIPPIILIIGGSFLVIINARNFSKIILWCTYVACFFFSLYWVQLTSLPHLIRTQTGRISPTFGMIIGEINALVGVGGTLSIIVIFWISHNKKTSSPIIATTLQVLGIFLLSLFPGIAIIALGPLIIGR